MVKYPISEWSSHSLIRVYISTTIRCIVVRLLPVHVLSYPQIDLYQINLLSRKKASSIVDEIVFRSPNVFYFGGLNGCLMLK